VTRARWPGRLLAREHTRHGVQIANFSGVSSSSSRTKPASVPRSWRTVIAALPFWANSGQWEATGGS
jgi:hypothetical protein